MRLDPSHDRDSLPKRAQLPRIAGTPEGSAWFWGDSDELGRLNLLTPERVRKAAQENIRTGGVVSLNLSVVEPSPPLFGRKHFAHSIKPIGGGAFDDETSYNTQASSQWDGFRHFRDPTTERFYNGTVLDEIITEKSLAEGGPQESEKLGIDAWARRGIAGRGLLLDIYSWSQSHAHKRFEPFSKHVITVADLKACAESQRVTFQTGDILLIRTGWLQQYNSLTIDQRNDGVTWNTMNHKCAGLEASEEMKDFLHDFYFAAAASDNPSLEAWPPESFAVSLHASMLPLWGMPIGELWNLEALSQKCQQEKRWAFLVTSAPANVPGGVASPPNALALF
ncbi:hypothetical protein C7974DRAFT_381646 [Boeremia exigua]|uniref:uncharacterized protein n=1 Tax=Boeremia exigua TaxID=749465 RepID=UPI001E8CE1D8|nr:uncharacterized protein C7974DRAFT_381646 [Boeremia exigua]KAH6643490.1 hypothetical protein C7974DRAFT_381646 [Boeremia exigua]